MEEGGREFGLDVTILKKAGVHLGWPSEATWGSRCRGYVGSVSVLFSCRGYVVSFAFGSEGEKGRRRREVDLTLNSNNPNLKGGEQYTMHTLTVPALTKDESGKN